MRVSAQLHVQTGMRQPSQVRRHDRNRAAEKSEGRNLHARVFDGQELADAAFGGGAQHVQGIEPAFFRPQLRLRRAAHRFAAALAETGSFLLICDHGKFEGLLGAHARRFVRGFRAGAAYGFGHQLERGFRRAPL